MESITPEVKKLLASLKRKRKQPAIAREFKCFGGPFDGKHIILTTDKTLTFHVRDHKGYYACSTVFHTSKRVDWFPLQ